MTADQSSTPKRALGPLPDDPAATGGRFSSEAPDDAPLPDSPEDPGEATMVLRRLALSPNSPGSPTSPSSPSSPSHDDPLTAESSTPVPPPLPVLPEPDAALPPSAGRRFSATAEPLEYSWAAPRRSAVSPRSPGSPNPAIESALPPAPTRPTAPPAVAVAAPTLPPPPQANRPAKADSKPRSGKPALIIIGAVVAVVALVAGVVWLLTLSSTAPSGAPSTSATASAPDPLITAEELGTLGGATWTPSTATNDEARPICLPAEADGLPPAQRTTARQITSSTPTGESVINVVDTYADATEATTAYQARLAQAGTCPDTVVYLTGASAITGLADSSDAVRLTVQNEADEYHSLQLTRTGRTVSLIDVLTATAPVSAADVANASAASLNRQCAGSGGSCPTSIEVASAPPPAGSLPGWLVEADLPRITPAVGRWGATDPATTLHLVGSQCEAIDLNAVAGTESVGQRTFLLADDAAAPTGFGVDQAVYRFSTEAAATKLRNKLVKNISNCPGRAPTATVSDGPSVKGTGADGQKISGSTFLVTQKTEASTVVFRVAVLTVGSKVVYLLANPSDSFDFSDADWRQIAVRSGERVSQE